MAHPRQYFRPASPPRLHRRTPHHHHYHHPVETECVYEKIVTTEKKEGKVEEKKRVVPEWWDGIFYFCEFVRRVIWSIEWRRYRLAVYAFVWTIEWKLHTVWLLGWFWGFIGWIGLWLGLVSRPLKEKKEMVVEEKDEIVETKEEVIEKVKTEVTVMEKKDPHHHHLHLRHGHENDGEYYVSYDDKSMKEFFYGQGRRRHQFWYGDQDYYYYRYPHIGREGRVYHVVKSVPVLEREQREVVDVSSAVAVKVCDHPQHQYRHRLHPPLPSRCAIVRPIPHFRPHHPSLLPRDPLLDERLAGRPERKLY